ncbi:MULTISPECIES: PHB depolymerase family esterase [unclassified Azospirillum]|uniref:extracellular catalytic domain type 1 short-chain-length polyhydroxyalkanoate depolymerase n=1 Tax=unclassified Azospirillum TaxID=2630922 RepID=UPI000D64DD4C|nr:MULTISPECIES: PHB depolymerase family esterase [unclassified Azospirillum]
MSQTRPTGFPPGMDEVARLTRAGRLAEATGLVQRLLRGEGATEPAATPATVPDPTLLEGEFVNLDAAPGPQARSDTSDRARPAGKMPGGRSGKGARTGLGETLRGLAARLQPTGLLGGTGAPRLPAEPLPDGASFATASHSGAAGTRAYKLYVPANRGDGLRPLVVMLHGCTQSPDDFSAGTRMNAFAERHGVYVAYPEQPASANAQRCWNWFKPEDQRRGHGEPDLLAGITRRIIHDHPIDPNRVYIAGLSAGGAAAAIMGEAYPDLYAAVGVHSGLPAGAAHDLPSALAAMRQGDGGATGRARAGRAGARQPVPTIIFHGDRDTVVHPRNGDHVAARATAAAAGLDTEVQHGEAPGRRSYSRTLHTAPSGRALCELWAIHGAGHAWAGGSPSGSYTDPQGPDATAEMLRFFLGHQLRTASA